MAGVLNELYDKLEKVGGCQQPVLRPAHPGADLPDLLALLPFTAMVAILSLAGCGKILAGREC
jgi:hypothetical protein